MLRLTRANLCLWLCRFATAYEGKYSDAINQAYVYPSSNYLDDIAWGAAWLYQRTGEQQFLTVSLFPNSFALESHTLSPILSTSACPKEWCMVRTGDTG